jgi:tripartite-type tricarboxylate transporter receptor subunit TctC
MKLPHRREFLHLAGGAAALPAMSPIGAAQAYPSRPIHLIVAFPPGGGTDLTARLMGQWLSERLGQPFIVENRPGGNSNIATEAVVRAPPDGYTLLAVATPSAINATLYDKLNFMRDIAPVAVISREANVILVNPSVPAKTVPEFIAFAKANAGKINYASPGNGTAGHVSGELFKMMAVSTWCTCLIAAERPRSSTCLAGRCKSSWVAYPGRSSTSGPVGCGR